MLFGEAKLTIFFPLYNFSFVRESDCPFLISGTVATCRLSFSVTCKCYQGVGTWREAGSDGGIIAQKEEHVEGASC